MKKEEKTKPEVVDELFFISEVKMKEADIEIVELELESEEESADKENVEVSEDVKAQEGGTEV